jgi:hypothetical protein
MRPGIASDSHHASTSLSLHVVCGGSTTNSYAAGQDTSPHHASCDWQSIALLHPRGYRVAPSIHTMALTIAPTCWLSAGHVAVSFVCDVMLLVLHCNTQASPPPGLQPSDRCRHEPMTATALASTPHAPAHTKQRHPPKVTTCPPAASTRLWWHCWTDHPNVHSAAVTRMSSHVSTGNTSAALNGCLPAFPAGFQRLDLAKAAARQ